MRYEAYRTQCRQSINKPKRLSRYNLRYNRSFNSEYLMVNYLRLNLELFLSINVGSIIIFTKLEGTS